MYTCLERTMVLKPLVPFNLRSYEEAYGPVVALTPLSSYESGVLKEELLRDYFEGWCIAAGSN